MRLEWFNERINHYAKLIGIQKIKKYYTDGRTLKLITCMALREAGERHHDNAVEAGNYRQWQQGILWRLKKDIMKK